jgi:hypothetical protein
MEKEIESILDRIYHNHDLHLLGSQWEAALEDAFMRGIELGQSKMKAENARLREALIFRGYDPDSELKHHEQEAREALRGDITPDKGGE